MRFGQKHRSEVDLAIDAFRDLINDLPRLSGQLIRAGVDWNMLCSAMDVIDHTEAAIKSYEEMTNPENLGALYLSVYGLFQSMIVQQDALKNIFKILKVDLPEIDAPPLSTIRDRRNDCIGHPTSRTHKVEPRSNFLFNPNWTKEHFTLNRAFHSDAPDDMIEIYPLALALEQRIAVSQALNKATGALAKIENDHRNKFKDRSCQKFLNGYLYHFEKIMNSFDPDYQNEYYLGQQSFQKLAQDLDVFKTELKVRELLGSLPALDASLENIQHPLERLCAYFEDKSKVDSRDAKSFARDFKSIFADLHLMAGEIDQEYKEILHIK